MSTAGWVASALLAVITLAVIVIPLLRRPDEAAQASLELEKLRLDYERVLITIRDLDEDHATGKLSVTDYEADRIRYVQQGVALLQRIDGLTPQAKVVPTETEEAEDAIEAAIARARGKAC